MHAVRFIGGEEMKKTKCHLIMPMAGRGSRFNKEGFDVPKPLIRIYGKPFFYWSTRSISKFLEVESLDFVVLQEHVDSFNIDQEILKYFPEARLHILQNVTEGAVITCLKGIVDINDDLPILFNDCDHLFKCTKLIEYFCNGIDENIDGLLLTFLSDENKYSFVEKDKKGNVIRTVEKQAISNEAICGCYYFLNAECFKQAASKYLRKCNYNEYFMSGIYNIMIDEGCCIKSLHTDFHVPFGVPDEYKEAQKLKYYEELI